MAARLGILAVLTLSLVGPLAKTSEPEAEAVPVPAGRSWRLVWHDEFNGNRLNSRKWNVLHNSHYGDGNRELQCYYNRAQNVRVRGGKLLLEARKSSRRVKCGKQDRRFPRGRVYSSAHLTTKGKASFKYGRFVMRARLPVANGSSEGMWPAFWMRPVDGGVGELDVMEAAGTGRNERGQANKTEHTIHYDYKGTHKKVGRTAALPRGRSHDRGMHTYVVIWRPGDIRWFVDGRRVAWLTRRHAHWIPRAFNRHFFLRLNLAIGGPWIGAPDRHTRWPQSFQIDYIRVYR